MGIQRIHVYDSNMKVIVIVFMGFLTIIYFFSHTSSNSVVSELCYTQEGALMVSTVTEELGGLGVNNNIVILVDNPLQGIHDKLHEIIHIRILGDILGSICPQSKATKMGLGSLEEELGSDADRTAQGGTEGIATRTTSHGLLEG
jgi:hypothetical protein